jgi:hypothetical protein
MIRLCSISALQKHPVQFAGLAFFLYAALGAIAIQFFVLPYMLPSLHAGNGLLRGTDYPELHKIAAHMAGKITSLGWGAWELLPNGQSTAGIASAIYGLGFAEPWALIPANAALHALGGALVMRLILIMTSRPLLAFSCGAMYVCFPSSWNWISQIQKDSTYFAGALCVLLGLTLLVRAASRTATRDLKTNIFFIIVLVTCGLLLIGVARLYALEIIMWVIGILAVISLPWLLLRWKRRLLSTANFLLVILVFASTIIVCKLAPKDIRTTAIYPTESSSGEVTPSGDGIITKIHRHSYEKIWNKLGALSKAQTPIEAFVQCAFLPEAIDHIFFRMGVARYGWASSYPEAGSMIDEDVIFKNAVQMILYAPRAIQIGLLAPFPEQWIAPGKSPGGTMLRRVTGLEMTLLYPMLLVGLPMAAWRWRSDIAFWMITTFCLVLIILYAYAVPNLGSLYRLRYGFLMTLAGIGFAALWMSIQDWLKYNRRTLNS